MVTIKEMTFVEYRFDYESLQLLKGNCLRLDDSKLPPIKNMRCFGNNLKKFISYIKGIHEYEFLKEYGRIVEITKVSIHNSTIKALMHFRDSEYRASLLGM
jgi:hypothetical protein